MLYPLHCVLIAQPELPGLLTYRADSMWISAHSMAWYPTLIEIEVPHKRYFRKKELLPQISIKHVFNLLNGELGSMNRETPSYSIAQNS